MIIEKIEPTEVVEVNDLSETLRGEGGFGSTGILSENKGELNGVSGQWYGWFMFVLNRLIWCVSSMIGYIDVNE